MKREQQNGADQSKVRSILTPSAYFKKGFWLRTFWPISEVYEMNAFDANVASFIASSFIFYK